MKTTLKVSSLIVVLMAAPAAMAQNAPAGLGTSNCAINSAESKGGQLSVGVLGRDDVPSSKFQEYKEVPKGVAVPCFNLFSKTDMLDFRLFGYNVSQDDQRYTGWFKTKKFDLTVDYNQIVHNMGNDAHVIQTEIGQGLWAIADPLQQTIQTTVDTTSNRSVDFYDKLLAPVFAAAGTVDISTMRKRTGATFDLSKSLPFKLSLSYVRELKDGYRGEEGGALYSTVSSTIEMPSPLHDVTQDIGLKAAYNFDKGNIHGSFNRNLYDNQLESLTIDNLFQATDTPYNDTTSLGGGSRARWTLAPDNEASTTNLGFLLKFGKQTRLGGDLSLGQWTQNMAFLPYTINTAVKTTSGANASSLSVLPKPSFDGKIDTTMINLTFASRPTENLGLHASFRSYDLTNKTNRFVITGDVAETPDRDWSTTGPTPEAPYGRDTANVYDHKSTKFTVGASYDLGALTLEGQARIASITRTSRDSTKNDENTYSITALYHAKDWLSFRGTYDDANRTVEGTTLYGYMSDEAERKTKRASIDAELSLTKGLDLTFAYALRDVTYPNRPDRIAVSNGVPSAGAQPIPNTPSGLLDAKYDSYTAEISWAPNDKVELGAYYTYEKDRTTNQWSTTSGVALNNLLNYAASDKSDTFGGNALFHLKPDVWTFSVNALKQKVDGLADITAREAGAFYTPGRTTLIPAGQGGAKDIGDWDDSVLTTVTAQLDYIISSAWTLSAGYWYEKYSFKDAYQVGTNLMPQSVILVLKSNDSDYKANVVYGKLTYRF
jgi:hypothetical protein